MLDSLNLIHDIAERGNLFCECGNDDIELLLLSDRIYLRCNLCPGNKIIYADVYKRQFLPLVIITYPFSGISTGGIPSRISVTKGPSITISTISGYFSLAPREYLSHFLHHIVTSV